MPTQSTTSPATVLPGQGRSITAFGDTIIVHLSGEQTGGKFTLFTSHVPPGGGPPPHYHANEEETFYHLEGRIEFFKDGQWFEVPVGSVVYTPSGVVHTFRNPGDTPAKMLVTASPSGFEIFFARCAEVFARSGPPDMERILGIAAEHGIHFA